MPLPPRPDGYVIDIDSARIDLDLVHRWLTIDTSWARGRTRDVVERAAAASVNLAAFAPEGSQVAYARVVTDAATFGWLCDVYVVPEHRGRGLGTDLARAAVEHLEPYGLSRFLLSTIDAHAVYARAGFVPFPDPAKLMILDRDR